MQERYAIQAVCATVMTLGARLLAAPASTDEIPPLKPPLPQVPPSYWEQNRVWILICVGVGSILVFLVIRWILRPKPVKPIPPGVVARQKLEPFRGRALEPAALTFVSRSLREYLTAAFGLPQEESTTTEFAVVLAANADVGSELASSGSDFLKRCDRAKFAPDASGSEWDAAGEALELVQAGEARRAARVAVASQPQ